MIIEVDKNKLTILEYVEMDYQNRILLFGSLINLEKYIKTRNDELAQEIICYASN